MQFNEFIPQALRTESPIANNTNLMVLEILLNLAFNTTEVMDLMKKNIFYSKPIPPEKIDALFDAIIMTAAAARMAYKQAQDLTPEVLEQIVRPVGDIIDPRYLHGVLGVYTEAGELLKTLGAGKESLDIVSITEEVGDLAWYLALISDSTGIDFEVALDKVISKLKARYPDKFSSDLAINRDVVAEREVLEQ